MCLFNRIGQMGLLAAVMMFWAGQLSSCEAQNNSFKTVVIGGKTWMAQNLNVKTMNSWCYDNDDSYCIKYGRLYAWDAAKTACPSGWYLPTREDWQKMVEFAGGRDMAGRKLKSTSDWNERCDNMKCEGGSDDYGFRALPGGSYGSKFVGAINEGNWWTATENGAYYAYNMNMIYFGRYVVESVDAKGSGFSVRCVSD